MGVVTILAWPGQPAAPATQHSGVKWILPANWLPFQKSNFVTPAFPGYISGHSTFSRSAAEVLAAITGSPYFPGGMGIYNAPAETSLPFVDDATGVNRAVDSQVVRLDSLAAGKRFYRVVGSPTP